MPTIYEAVDALNERRVAGVHDPYSAEVPPGGRDQMEREFQTLLTGMDIEVSELIGCARTYALKKAAMAKLMFNAPPSSLITTSFSEGFMIGAIYMQMLQREDAGDR